MLQCACVLAKDRHMRCCRVQCIAIISFLLPSYSWTTFLFQCVCHMRKGSFYTLSKAYMHTSKLFSLLWFLMSQLFRVTNFFPFKLNLPDWTIILLQPPLIVFLHHILPSHYFQKYQIRHQMHNIKTTSLSSLQNITAYHRICFCMNQCVSFCF